MPRGMAHTRHLTSPRLLPIWQLLLTRYSEKRPGPTSAEISSLTGTMAPGTDLSELRRIVAPLGWTILPARFVKRVGRNKVYVYDLQRTNSHLTVEANAPAPANTAGLGETQAGPAPTSEDRP